MVQRRVSFDEQLLVERAWFRLSILLVVLFVLGLQMLLRNVWQTIFEDQAFRDWASGLRGTRDCIRITIRPGIP